ncbi:MAG: hypothetical protein WAO23_01230 [Dethiobacteria bacterium]
MSLQVLIQGNHLKYPRSGYDLLVVKKRGIIDEKIEYKNLIYFFGVFKGVG